MDIKENWTYIILIFLYNIRTSYVRSCITLLRNLIKKKIVMTYFIKNEIYV